MCVTKKFDAAIRLRIHKEFFEEKLQRKFTCDECDHKQEQERSLRFHKRKPHAYFCKECGLKFVRECELKHHKDRLHATDEMMVLQNDSVNGNANASSTGNTLTGALTNPKN